MLDRFSHLGFVFFEDVNVDIRCDFSIVSPVCLEMIENNEMFDLGEHEMTAEPS